MSSGEVKSKPYELEVLKKPNLSQFNIRMDFPGYIGRKSETIQNIGDLFSTAWVLNFHGKSMQKIR
jgi:hypothetical protein